MKMSCHYIYATIVLKQSGYDACRVSPIINYYSETISFEGKTTMVYIRKFHNSKSNNY